jgi:hypothetical protein
VQISIHPADQEFLPDTPSKAARRRRVAQFFLIRE